MCPRVRRYRNPTYLVSERYTIQGDAYPRSTWKCHKFQIGAQCIVSVYDVLKHVAIGSNLFNVIADRGKDC
jgi:hypothetical protein